MSNLYNNTIAHLKKINFTLLILTTIVLVMSILVKKSDIERALDDLSNLQAVFIEKQIDTNRPLITDDWLIDRVDSAVENSTYRTPFKKRVKVVLKGREITLTYPSYYLEKAKWIKDGKSSYVPPLLKDQQVPSTIREIKRFWNGLHETVFIHFIKKPDSELYFDKATNSMVKRKLALLNDASSILSLYLFDIEQKRWIDDMHAEFFDVKPSFLTKEILEFIEPANLSYRILLVGSFGDRYLLHKGNQSNEQSLDFVLIPFEVATLPFSPLELLVEEVPKRFDWHTGSFEFTFRALNETTQDIQHMPISDIMMILENELARASGTVNAFGVAIPYEVISQFGALAIFIMQLYFTFYLRFFHTHFEKDTTIEKQEPWIYLHERADALLVYFIVSVAYPAGVALFFTVTNATSSTGFDFVINAALLVAEILILLAISSVILSNNKETLSIFSVTGIRRKR